MYLKIFSNYIEKKKHRLKGFSIIEMMIVLVIIGIVATLSISTLTNTLSKAKIKAAQIQAHNLTRSLEMYKLQFGEFPNEKDGWNSLLNPPDGIPLIKNIPTDPWKNQFVYIYPGDHNAKIPDVLSRGPDGKFSDDDIGNW